METCVYCGKKLENHLISVKVRTRSFAVCSVNCKSQAEAYIYHDKRYKTILYLLVFAGGLGFIFSAFFGGSSKLQMLGAYIGQLTAGLAFLFFPYPVDYFESFHAMCIRKVIYLTRAIGLLLSGSAAVFIVMTMRHIA